MTNMSIERLNQEDINRTLGFRVRDGSGWIVTSAVEQDEGAHESPPQQVSPNIVAKPRHFRPQFVGDERPLEPGIPDQVSGQDLESGTGTREEATDNLANVMVSRTFVPENGHEFYGVRDSSLRYM